MHSSEVHFFLDTFEKAARAASLPDTSWMLTGELTTWMLHYEPDAWTPLGASVVVFSTSEQFKSFVLHAFYLFQRLAEMTHDAKPKLSHQYSGWVLDLHNIHVEFRRTEAPSCLEAHLDMLKAFPLDIQRVGLQLAPFARQCGGRVRESIHHPGWYFIAEKPTFENALRRDNTVTVPETERGDVDAGTLDLVRTWQARGFSPRFA